MQDISASDNLKDYQKKMVHNRRIIAQAKAIMTRAKGAGIPDRFMRINQKDFESILDPSYHKDISKMSEYIYHHPMHFIKRGFIIIDGGDVLARKIAGFAVLFRIIACDKYGQHQPCAELVHQLQSIRSYDGPNRNDIADVLKDTDTIFISECLREHFRQNFETGSFFDEILGHRDDHQKPTIISFTRPLAGKNGNTDNVLTEIDQYGQYLCLISQTDQNKDKRFFRIRVKTNA